MSERLYSASTGDLKRRAPQREPRAEWLFGHRTEYKHAYCRLQLAPFGVCHGGTMSITCA